MAHSLTERADILRGSARFETGLEMRGRCKRCAAHLTDESEALICSYECTFCSTCAVAMDHTCPNCDGELARRPRRRKRTL